MEQLSLDQATTVKAPLDTGHYMVASGGLFAPTIRHHDGTFYIICTNYILREDGRTTENFIVSTTDIWKGDWTDPVYIPFNGIDPSLLFDEDGRVYFQGCFSIDRMKQPSCTIKQFEIDIKTGQPLSEMKEIWGGHAKYDTEGPHIYKIGRWYYLLVAEGGTFEHHMLCIGRSEGIWGPYEDYEHNPILTADGTDEYIQNTGHGELFQDGNGNWWAVCLGVRNEKKHHDHGSGVSEAPLGRESFLTLVEWPEGGWPRISQPKMKFLADCVDSTPTASTDDIEDPGQMHAIDEFGSFPAPPRVGDLYIRTPDMTKYSISGETGDDFSLFPSTASLSISTGTSTFIGKRQRSLNSMATATFDISNVGRGIRTGLALYKDHLRHVSVVYDSDTKKVSCHVIALDVSHTLPVEIDVNATTETLLECRIVANPEKWVFSAKVGSGHWTELGGVASWDLMAREMTGPIFGVFAHAGGADPGERPVRVTQFVVEG